MGGTISQQAYDNMERRLKQVEEILQQLAVIDKEGSGEKLHGAIQNTLSVIGEYTGAGRVYIFDRSDEDTEYSNTYEWCAEGVIPQIHNLQHVQKSAMPCWNEIFEKGQSIVIQDLEEIKDTTPSEYEILKMQDVCSEIAVPVFYKERLTGFIGLDNPSMEDRNLLLQLLNLVGTHLGSNRENIRMVDLLEQKQKRLQESLELQEREKQILNVLCYDYTCVYMVDLQKDEAEIVKLESSSNASELIGKEEHRRTCYSKLVKKYYDYFVVKSEHPDFLDHFNPKRIIEEMKHTDRISYRYHTWPNADGKEIFEVQVTRLHTGTADQKIVMGFRHIDDIVKEERKNQNSLKQALEEAKLNNEIISAISKIYFAIYRIDLNADFYEEVSSDNEVHSLTGAYGKASDRMKEICYKFVTPEYQNRVMEFFNLSTLKDRMKEEETIAIEYLAQDGNWHLARFIEKKRNQNGELENVLYVTRLISEQKRREQYWIMTAEAANKANEAKSEFLSRMSHDIRTPLNVITGLVDVAKAHIGEQEKIEDCLDKISMTGRNLQNLVNDVLDIKQIESGKFEIHPKEMKVMDLYESVQKMLDQDILKRDLKFSCIQHDIQYPCLLADQLRLEQICTNLLSNAVKYTPDGGSVSFELYEKESHNAGKIQLISVISDTGIGMTPEFMEEMYSEFSRAIDTRVNKVRGSGLGLAIVKKIVDLMDGTIEVESKPDHGTRFCVTFELPWIEENADQKIQKKVSLYGMKLLIAEDNDLSYEVEKELLNMQGVSCVRAENGKICVEKMRNAASGTYDAILMDMQMPVMDGPTAAKEIRKLAHPQAEQIPIIAVTANAYKRDIQKCLDSGMNEHLAKPVDYQKLAEMLAKLCK